MKNTAYWTICSDMWTVLKKYVPLKGRFVYDQMYEDCRRIAEKHYGTDQGAFANDIMIAICKELSRQHIADPEVNKNFRTI